MPDRSAVVHRHPQNFRAYGLLRRGPLVLIAAEYVGAVFCWKFPGGGVKDDETAEQAIVREFEEECGLAVRVGALLHDPGTLISPWTGRPYTPIYFRIEADGEPLVPPHEEVDMSFRTPDEALASGLMARPETIALGLLFRDRP